MRLFAEACRFAGVRSSGITIKPPALQPRPVLGEAWSAQPHVRVALSRRGQPGTLRRVALAASQLRGSGEVELVDLAALQEAVPGPGGGGPRG